MIRMESVWFLISVYCFLNVVGYDDGLFSPQPAKCLERENDTKRGNLINDDEIDLNSITRGTLKYNKYAMLLVCRILDRTFFKTSPSLASLTSLEQFGEFDQSREIKESMESSREPSDGRSNISPILVVQMELSARVLREYDALISAHEDPAKKALYYNLLKWLENEVNPKREIKNEITQIFKTQKAQNYLYQIIRPEKLQEFVNLSDTTLKTIKGWTRFDDHYLKSLLLSLEIVEENRLKNISLEDIPSTNVEIYEHIFARSDIKQFKKLFLDKEPWKILRSIDRFFDAKSKITSDIKSSYVAAPPSSEIILPKDNPIQHLKHVTILFYQALFEKFNIHLPKSRTSQELRFCAFFDLAIDLINELYQSVGNFEHFFKNFLSKAYFRRLVLWYKNEINTTEVPKDCTNVLDKLDQLLIDSNTKHNLTELLLQENQSSTFAIHDEKIDLTRLKALGEYEDEVLSTLIKFRLDELATEYGDEKAEHEIQKQCPDPFGIINEQETYNEKLDGIKQARSKILRYGWPSNDILNTNVKDYENLLNSMDDDKFKQIFGKNKAQMLDTVKKALANASSIDETFQASVTSPKIDLKNITIKENMENYTNTMLLYSQILTYKFFDNKRPSFNSLTKLDEYLKFSLSDYDEDNDDIDPCSWSLTDFTFQKLVKLCVEILSQYDFVINTTNEYSDQAFYYNALQWLNKRVENNNVMTELIKEITGSKKARNYFLDLLPDDEILNFDFLSDKYKKLDGWKESDETNDAIDFALKIAKTRGSNASSLPMNCTNIEIYEQILSVVDEAKFQDLFQTSTLDMLRIIDYSFDVKSTQNLAHSPYNQDNRGDQIDLINDESKIPLYVVPYMKHVFILFATAFEKIIKVEFLQHGKKYELENYPIRYEPYNDLRYCSIRWWLDTIPYLAKRKLDSMSYEELTFPMRAYLFRLKMWLKYQAEKSNMDYSKCQHIRMVHTEQLFESEYVTHILADVIDENEVKIVLNLNDQDMNIITTLKQLIKLSGADDDAVNFMMQISLNELNLDDRQETINYTTRILSYGKPEAGRKAQQLQVYKRLLNAVNESKFVEIFRIKPKDMLDKVEQELTRQNPHTLVTSTTAADKMTQTD